MREFSKDRMRIVHIAEAIERLEAHAGGLAESELHEDVLRYYGIANHLVGNQ